MASQSSAPASAWPTQDEAANQLGVTVRTIRTMVSDHKLASRLQPVAGRKPVVRIDPQDIERILAERHKPVLLAPQTTGENRKVTGKLPETTGTTDLQILPQAEALDALAHRISELAREWWGPKAEPPSTPFLSLDQASAYSGLPRRLLGRWLRNGSLRGARHSGEWYLKKSDVDAMELCSQVAPED